jgi:hypothetical protein
MIEKPQAARSGGPEYYGVVDHDADQNIWGWTTEVDHGLKFDTQQHAQEYIDVYGIEDAVTVEHAWMP